MPNHAPSFFRRVDYLDDADFDLAGALQNAKNLADVPALVEGRKPTDVTGAVLLLLSKAPLRAPHYLAVARATGVRGAMRVAARRILEFPGRYDSFAVDEAQEALRFLDETKKKKSEDVGQEGNREGELVAVLG